MNTKVCAQCGKEIPFGTPYYMVGDNYLQVNYFDSANDNIFCSQECLCEALSVIEIPNDGSKTLAEELNLIEPSVNTNILKIVADVYPEDAEVNGVREPVPLESQNPDKIDYKMPGLGKIKRNWGTEWLWTATIDISSGKILNWPEGTTAKTWYKTSDCCGLVYLGKEYKDYVPDFLEIWDDGYGDYIYIEILSDGTIKDWDAEKCKNWLKEHFEDFR